MPLFKVDEKKCLRDGICIEICPLKIIESDNGLPAPALDADKLCINCGHCVAVCPSQAFSLESMSPEKCDSLSSDWNLDAQKIEYYMKGRRSVRVYKDQPVEKKKLEKLLDIARFAPSGLNMQPVEWIVVNGDLVKNLRNEVIEWMKELVATRSPLARLLNMKRIIATAESGKDPVCRFAFHVIIACAPTDDTFALVSSTIALAHLELAAPGLGLGACWAGYLQMAINASSKVKNKINFFDNYTCHGAMLIGVPKYNYKRIPFRKDLKVSWL